MTISSRRSILIALLALTMGLAACTRNQPVPVQQEPTLYNRLGAKPLAALGALCIAIAPFVFSLVGESSGYGSLVVGMVVLGVGIGSFYPTATTAGVTSVDESETSLAGGIVYMFQIAGGSIGLGLTTTVFSSQASFVDGVQAAFRLDAGLSLVGFLIALFFVGGRLLPRRTAESPAA